MLITSRDRLEPRAGEHTYALRVTLPEHRNTDQDALLTEHVDSFVRLYLTRFETRSVRASRTGPLRWLLVSGSQKMRELEAVRGELETALFGADRSGQIVLVEIPAEADETDEYIPAGADLAIVPESVSDAAAPDLQAEIAAFRADMKEIAASLHGTDVNGALDAFRSDLDALASRMETGIAEAAGRVEGAAERLDLAVSRLPDPDRLEIALTRNDASAALITNGLQESLKLLLKAVEGLERQNAKPKLLDGLGREAA